MMGIKRGYLQYKYQYHNIFLLFVKKPNGIDKKKRKKKRIIMMTSAQILITSNIVLETIL